MTTTPEGFSTLSAALIVKDANATIKSYEKALGAKLCGTMNCPNTGKVAHALLNIGGASLFVSDEFPDMGKNATGRQEFYLYVENADSSFAKGKDAGWQVAEELEDMFWGDRVGALNDMNGNTWKLAQKVRDVSPEEMQEAMKKMAEAG